MKVIIQKIYIYIYIHERVGVRVDVCIDMRHPCTHLVFLVWFVDPLERLMSLGDQILGDSSPIFLEDLENPLLAIVNPWRFGPMKILTFAHLFSETNFSQLYAPICIHIYVKFLVVKSSLRNLVFVLLI